MDSEEYTKLTYFNKFKHQVMAAFEAKDEQIFNLSTVSRKLVKENVSIIDKLEEINWDIMGKATALMNKKVADLDKLLEAHKDSIQASFL